MTYSVKNGTWCKDNNKEYYSTTKAGLKAALAAGEITAGTKVVIHEPKYHAGQLIQSLNPNCPEGCFVPHGQAFNKSIYEELAKVFPSGVLPDMRECVMVCAGQNTHITTHKHDVFNAGEFKDDCAIKHSHKITVTDPGHKHTVNISDPGHKHIIDVSDPGHNHTHKVIDPGHRHSVSDPGHDHGRGTFEITGKVEYISEPYSIAGTASGAFEKESGCSSGSTPGITDWDDTGAFKFKASNSWTGRSELVTTSVSVDNSKTGIAVNADSSTTGITASSNDITTGITASSNNNTTGITASCSTTGDSVTRTKQFGVYYYIAF